MKSVLIAGCGYLGLQLGSELRSMGFTVHGVARSRQSLDRIASLRLNPHLCDLRDPAQVSRLPAADRVIFCAAPGRGEDAGAIYQNGLESLLGHYARGGVNRVLMVSSTSVYGDRSDAWVDESTPVGDGAAGLSPNAGVILRAEKTLKAWSGRGIIARLSGIYGPGRDALERLCSSYPNWEGGNGWTNRVHRDDAARALVRLVIDSNPEPLWVVSDDEPVRRETYLRWMAESLGFDWGQIRLSSAQTRSRGSKRCSNQRLKSIGFEFRFPNYREGYAPLIAEYRKIAR